MSARRQPSRLPVTRWRVHLQRHTTCGRYLIAEARVTLPAPTADVAIGFAISEAHSRAGVPPWTPCRDESRRYASAERVGERRRAERMAA
jgi:hypothetical protein